MKSNQNMEFYVVKEILELIDNVLEADEALASLDSPYFKGVIDSDIFWISELHSIITKNMSKRTEE